MNGLNNGHHTPSKGSPPVFKTPNGTIRSVPAESLHLETPMSAQDENSLRIPSRSNSPALNSRAHGTSNNSQPPLSWQNNLPPNGLVRSLSSEFGPLKNYPGNNVRSPEEGSSSSNGVASPDSNPQAWSSAVGRANLGKSGRVIERLMGEKDMLKRDLQIERLRNDELIQATKMTEGRMEAMAMDFDTKLQDAAVNSTLLKRRERQLADAKAQLDSEKSKAVRALEREQEWKRAMEEMEVECKKKTETAAESIAMADGSTRIAKRHYEEKEIDISQTVETITVEVEQIVIDRREDDVHINTLRELCDQQRKQIDIIRKQNASLRRIHEKYKQVKDESMRDLLAKLEAQEEKSKRLIEEATEATHKLKWSLAVQESLRKEDSKAAAAGGLKVEDTENGIVNDNSDVTGSPSESSSASTSSSS